MSRILVIGMGVPGCVPSRRHAGPGLRAAHFATALSGAAHDVMLLAVLEPGEAAPIAGGAAPAMLVEYTSERELLGQSMRRRIDAFAPDAVVGVTVYAAALAIRLSLGVPLWADVFGDLMAEAQAKAARSGSDWSIVHFWTLLRGVLEGADRFSAVSDAQMRALVGQLGLAGRLSSRTAGETLVSTIACAADVACEIPDRALSRRELGCHAGDFVLLFSGGINTWCDVETLCRGVALAMDAEPRLRLLVTGGSIPGHDEASHATMMEMLRATGAGIAGEPASSSSRVQVLGWIDSSRLPALYAASDLALHIERPLYERMLGAENRVVEWLAHALPCATTALSETGEALVARGLALGCKAGDAADLARVIGEAAAHPAAVARAGRRGRDWLAAERGVALTAAPLLRWCDAPCFARDRDGARLVRLGLLSHPETSIEMLEAYVAALPATELARRGLRWIVRRSVQWISRRGLRRRPHARVRASGRRW